MVSIPPMWNRFARFGELPQKTGLTAQEINERHHKLKELEAIKIAQEEGYFFNLSNDFLVENFCEETHKDFKTIHYIRYAILHNYRIREITCLNFAMRLRICDLSCNYITRLDPLGPCRQLIKLDVHSNQITNIPNHHFWSGMKNLQILHLYDNPLSKMDTIQFLANCRKLTVLTLYDTPLHLRKNYRHHAVNTIWTLLVLDRHLVTDEEIIEDANFGGKFKTLSPFQEIDTTTPVLKETCYTSELAQVSAVIARVNKKLASASPVLVIQKYMRGCATRKRYAFIMETRQWAAKIIQHWWRRLKGVEISAPPPSRDKNTTPKPRERPASKRSKITINLQKLNQSTIEPLAIEQLALDSELPTYRSEPPRYAPRPLTPKQFFDTPRRPIKNFPYLNPYGSLEVAEELGELPRVHFRLSGIKAEIREVDVTNQVVMEKLTSGQQIRDVDTHYHRTEMYASKPKVVKHKFLNNDQRHFSRVHGTMNLSCLVAVHRAYKERDKAEVNLAKIEKIMNAREERLAAKRRVEAGKDEQRRRIILDRQREKLRNLETLEQQQIHNLHYLYKAQELRQRAQYFKHTVLREHTFANDFQNQQTSISNALLRHDRQSTMDNRQKSLVEFVSKHRDDELEQRDLIKRYLDHRRSMRQAEITLANASLDTKLLQESTDRLQKAHARVDQLRELRRKAREYCPLPEDKVKTIPNDDDTSKAFRGLDKWNTTVSVSSGRVGKHPITMATT